MMPDRPDEQTMERLKAMKSAFIIEARSLADQGLAAFAVPFYIKAAELEQDLAEFFSSRNDERNSRVSWFSAASCLVQARQYRTAAGILERLADRIPEAANLMEDCRDKEDAPVVAETPALHVLIDLLKKKHVLTADEWTEALLQK